jgi:hypothetical protein
VSQKFLVHDLGDMMERGFNRVVEVVDQRDIQRMGGLHARFPSSYVVCKLLKSINARRVLDVTYGVGRFYRLCRRGIELLIASDPVKWRWVVAPDTFYQVTVWQLYNMVRGGKVRIPDVDVVVCDPPRFSRGGNRRDEYNYIIGTHNLIIEYSVKLAKLLGVRHFILHFNRIMDLGNIEYIVEFNWMARYLYANGTNNKSYFILYDIAG